MAEKIAKNNNDGNDDYDDVNTVFSKKIDDTDEKKG